MSEVVFNKMAMLKCTKAQWMEKVRVRYRMWCEELIKQRQPRMRSLEVGCKAECCNQASRESGLRISLDRRVLQLE